MVTCVLVEEVSRGHTPDNLVGQRVTSEHRAWTTSEVRGPGWLVRQALVFNTRFPRWRGGCWMAVFLGACGLRGVSYSADDNDHDQGRWLELARACSVGGSESIKHMSDGSHTYMALPISS